MLKTVFSIKNLENLSGIKAHTFRIWEKRYNLLSPERTDTNIRSYSLDQPEKTSQHYLTLTTTVLKYLKSLHLKSLILP